MVKKNWLRGMKTTKVDLVTQGADQYAKVLITKSDDGSSEEIELGAILDELLGDDEDVAKGDDSVHPDEDQGAQALEENISPETINKEEGGMPKITEEERSALPDNVQEYLSSLESGSGTTPATDDTSAEAVLKSEELPEPVRKALEDSAAAQAALAAELKIEKNLRRSAAWQGRIDSLNNIETPEDIVKSLLDLEDASPELAENLFKTLSSASAQLEASEVFKEIGTTGPSEGGALRSEKVAKMAAADGVSYEETVAKMAESDPEAFLALMEENA